MEFCVLKILEHNQSLACVGSRDGHSDCARLTRVLGAGGFDDGAASAISGVKSHAITSARSQRASPTDNAPSHWLAKSTCASDHGTKNAGGIDTDAIWGGTDRYIGDCASWIDAGNEWSS